MKILVACEESQRVCIAFREKGHTAFSCDVQEPSGGHPEWHILGNALEYLKGGIIVTMDGNIHVIEKWDLLIAHPPCTYLTKAGAVRMRNNGEIVEERYDKAMKAKAFFMKLYNSNIPMIAVENPTPMKLVGLPPYTQAIQPYEYGHPYSKRTCLWLKGLPNLEPTEIVKPLGSWVNGGSKKTDGSPRKNKVGGAKNKKERSKTFSGIAKAMAEQWGVMK